MAMETLRDLWERNASLHPERIVAVDANRRLTYAELFDRATRLAGALGAGGVRRGDRVSILSMNRVEYLEVLAANHVLGSIAATLNFRLAAPELEWILGDSRPRVLIFEERYLDQVEAMRPRLAGVERYIAIGDAPDVPDWAEPYAQVVDGGSPEPPPARPEAEDTAHLIYTSGTTGRPKGVMRSHRSEVYQAESMACAMDLRPDSRILEVMPLFHVGAQASAWGTLWQAGSIYIHNGFDPVELLRAVEAFRITHLHLVPLMIQDILDAPDLDRFDLSSLETLLYSAAPITPAVLRRGIERLGPVFAGMWGMTEGSGTLLPKGSHRPDGEPEEVALLSSVGQQLQRAELRIVDDDGRDCPPGHAGELWLRSPTMLSGYWNNSAATLDALRGGWLRTGDMGYFDERRNIHLVDRKKDMIISGGENIYSQEVERALAEHPDVDRVAVIGVPDERWGEAVAAIIVRRADATADAAALIEHCQTQIASYKKPRRVEFVDELPALASGKVDKVALRKRFGTAA